MLFFYSQKGGSYDSKFKSSNKDGVLGFNNLQGVRFRTKAKQRCNNKQVRKPQN